MGRVGQFSEFLPPSTTLMLIYHIGLGFQGFFRVVFLLACFGLVCPPGIFKYSHFRAEFRFFFTGFLGL